MPPCSPLVTLGIFLTANTPPGPPQCPNRAAERRRDMRALLASKGYTRVLDMTSEESGAAPAYFEVALPPAAIGYGPALSLGAGSARLAGHLCFCKAPTFSLPFFRLFTLARLPLPHMSFLLSPAPLPPCP